MHPRSYELSLKVWEGGKRELNRNGMVSQHGTPNLFDFEDRAVARQGQRMELSGIDDELLALESIRVIVSFLVQHMALAIRRHNLRSLPYHRATLPASSSSR